MKQLLINFYQRIMFGGFTYDEACARAGGGGKGAPAPIPIAPPVAPPAEDTATLETAPDTATEKKAQTKGAKSLQIPLGTIGGNKPLNI